MSIASWKEEYLKPISADMTPLEAAQHSLAKWQGLRSEALSRHKLVKVGGVRTIRSEFFQRFSIDSKSCALCEIVHSMCDKCALFRFLGSQCDGGGPYSTWSDNGNPEPMIKALEGTISMLEGDNNPTATTDNTP